MELKFISSKETSTVQRPNNIKFGNVTLGIIIEARKMISKRFFFDFIVLESFRFLAV